MSGTQIRIAATAAFGLEAVTARELVRLGYDGIEIDNGRVAFTGTPRDVCVANLRLRTADRVLIVLDKFRADTFDDLFEGIKRFPWEEWLGPEVRFPVSGKCVRSKLMSVSDCQSITKKAVVERLKQKYHTSWFKETGPEYHIGFSILKDNVEVTLDTSGVGLHKRGYRRLVGHAPLKETMAAALILISRWNRSRILVDPFCGSGTIPVEAAMIGMNMAPGMNRTFSAEEWPQIPRNIWRECREEAGSTILNDRSLRISGYDIDPEMIDIASHSAREAGVGDIVDFRVQDVREFKSEMPYGFIICNPPYGERTGEPRQLGALYSELGRVYTALDAWSCYVISANHELERHFGRKCDKKRKLYNGNIECNYYQYFGPPPPKVGLSTSE